MLNTSTIEPDQPTELGRPVATRLTEDERDRLLQLARCNDRVVAAEVRRAVRFYLANVETVDRALREQTKTIDRMLSE